MKHIIQHAVLQVIQRQVVQCTCDYVLCGQVCGTRENPKTTTTGPGGEHHYCKRPDHWRMSTEYERKARENSTRIRASHP